MRSCQTNLVLDMLRKSFSTPLCRKGVRLSSDDTQTVMEVYQQWLLLMTDLDYLHPDTLLRDARRLLTSMVEVDVLELNNAFSECLQLIRLQSNKGFKALCHIISPHLYSFVRADMELMMLGDVKSAKRLMQAFAYTSRLTLTDIDLTEQQVESYLACEDMILTELPDPLVRRLNKIVRRWMKSFDPMGIIPHHGKGAVAFLGRASLEVKYKNLRSDCMLRYAFGQDSPWLVDPSSPNLERISETKFVPKNYKTFRTISMEPPSLMYFQQGVWGAIDRVLSSRQLRGHMDVHDQERNRALAKIGSLNRNYATLDLSSASDLVSFELVKGVFAGTSVLRYLYATRSRQTLLPDGTLLSLKKFAPMGSALCFPIMTIIFASVCELVTRELRVATDYSVYGDDIIVPTQCADRTIEVLSRLGFLINNEKSFYHDTCWFRESCGGEYCDGYDVTPLRITRKYTHRERDVRLQGLIKMSNLAYERGFRALRGFYLRRMREYGYVPLFAPTSVMADNYTNYHTKKKWNRSYQCIQVRVTDMGAACKTVDLDSQDESIRYRHWFESTSSRKTAGDGFVSIICKPTRYVRNTWMTKPYEPIDQGFIDKSLGRDKNTGSLNSNR